MAQSLEYITTQKQEVLQVISKVTRREGDERMWEFASLQLDAINHVSVVTKDALAMMATERYLTRGESIFRQEWSIDEEAIKEGLTLTSHPVFMPYVAKYLRQCRRLNTSSLGDTKSPHYDNYFKLLSEKMPSVTQFFQTLQSTARLHHDQSSTGSANLEVSPTTSGIGSMSTAATLNQSRARKRRKLI